MAFSIPPWLAASGNHDPIGAFTRSLQIGASIGEAQTRIAEQQRQANMEMLAKREALQAQMEKAQQELLVEQAYKQQALELRRNEMEELAQRSAASLAVRQKHYEDQIAAAAAALKERSTFHTELNRIREERTKALAEGKNYGEPTTFPIPGSSALAVYRRGSPGLHVVNPGDTAATKNMDRLNLLSVQTLNKQLENAKKLAMDPDADPVVKSNAVRSIPMLETGIQQAAQALTNRATATGTSGPAATTGLPLPSTKADLQTGQIYQTSRGLARWNGTMFEPVSASVPATPPSATSHADSLETIPNDETDNEDEDLSEEE